MKNVNAEVRLTTREEITEPPRPKVSYRLSPVPVFPPIGMGLPFSSRNTSRSRRAVPDSPSTTWLSTERATRETSRERSGLPGSGPASSAV